MTFETPTISSRLQIGLGQESVPGSLPEQTLLGLTVRTEQFQAHSTFQRSRWLEQPVLPRFPVKINGHVSSRMTIDISAQPACLSLLAAALHSEWKSGWPALAANISTTLIPENRRISASHMPIAEHDKSLSLIRGFTGHNFGMHYGGMRAVETRLRLSSDSGFVMQSHLLGLHRTPLAEAVRPAQSSYQVFTPAFKPFLLALRWSDETEDAPLYLTDIELLIQFQTARPLFQIGSSTPATITSGKPKIGGYVQFIHQSENGFSWRDQNRAARLHIVLGNAGGHILGCEIPALKLIEDEQQTALDHAPVLNRLRFEAVAEATDVAPLTFFHLSPN